MRKSSHRKRRTPCPPHYFTIPTEINLIHALTAQIAGTGAREFWGAFKARNSVARRPHVTLVHSKQLPGCADLWVRCTAIYALPAPPLFRARFGHVDFNARIMAATVKELRMADPQADEPQAGSVFVSQLDHALHESLHVTIGLRDDADVRPVEAGALIAAFRKGAGTDMRSVPLDNVYIKGRVQGLFSRS
jgi:tRNA ligase